MAMDYTKAFALKLAGFGGWHIKCLDSVGVPPGVDITFAKGRNGPGMGKLRTSADGSSLRWRAPGSGLFGRLISCPANGTYVLEDGEDVDKALKVQVYSDYLEAGAETSVLLSDIYGARYSTIGDVTAAMAASGHIQSQSIDAINKSAGPMTDLMVWLDPDTEYYDISDDNVSWVSPTNEASALALATPIASGADDKLYLRRSIPSSCSSNPKVLVHLHFSFWLNAGEALSSKHYVETRGLFRIFNAVAYRFYRSNSAPPEESDEPFDTHSTLPHTPVSTYADGTWYISMSRFNGVLDSGFLPVGPNGETYLRLDLDSGAEVGSPPNAPLDWRLELRPNGVVRIIGTYYQVGELRATQWAIAYTTDESTPPADTPDETETMPVRGLAQLAYDLPAQDHDTIVKVRLQARRQDGETWVYSEGSAVLTVTADATGPSAPIALERYPGRLPESL